MNEFDQYSKDALRTASEGHLLGTTSIIQMLIKLKKNEELDMFSVQEAIDHLQILSQKDEQMVGLMYDALGLAGEAGEVADYIKKTVGHGKPFEPETLKKELGDVLWYLNRLVVQRIGGTLQEIAEKNIAKLKARYPQGFSFKASEQRPPE